MKYFIDFGVPVCHYQTITMIRTHLATIRFSFLLSGAVLLSLALVAMPRVHAACSAPSTDYGSATFSVSIPSTATYRIWSRMLAPSTSSNSYLLEVDGNQCYNVGGSGITANTWTWVAHHGGNGNNKIDLSLSKGNHSLRVIGNKPGVKFDRIVFSSDTACTPTGSSGTNCNVAADTAAPSIKLTEPQAGKTVGGTTAVSATASDDAGVTKVDFYVDSSVRASDTSAPYSFQWDTGTSGNGKHTLIAKAYDAAGNVGTDSYTVTVASGDKQPPTAPSGLTATSAVYNTVDLSWQSSVDDNGVRDYTIYRDNVPLATVIGVSYQDTGLFAATSYSYKVLATDIYSNNSGFSNVVTVTTSTVADDVAPSVPGGLTAKPIGEVQINLSWQPSADSVGVKAYDIYRESKGHKATKIAEATGTSFGDSSYTGAATYIYTVRARDASGNVSGASQSVSATVRAPSKEQSSLYGTVQDSRTKQPVKGALVTIVSGNTTFFHTTDAKGRYGFRGLAPARYSLSFRANGYESKSSMQRLTGNPTEHSVKLIKDGGR